MSTVSALACAIPPIEQGPHAVGLGIGCRGAWGYGHENRIGSSAAPTTPPPPNQEAPGANMYYAIATSAVVACLPTATAPAIHAMKAGSTSDPGDPSPMGLKDIVNYPDRSPKIFFYYKAKYD